MSNPLKPNEISDLLPNQSIYELINGQEWIVESTSRNEFTRLAILRKKDDPDWGTYTLNEIEASDFSLSFPTSEEIKNLQEAKDEESKWHGKYRKFLAPCNHGDTENEAINLIAGRTIDDIIDIWLSKYINIDTRLLTDMWCGLYLDVWGTSIYIEGDTPLLCFAMADKILTENPPSEDGYNAFWVAPPPPQ